MLTDVPEGTALLVLTPEKVNLLWGAFNQISGIFDDYAKGNFEAFMQKFYEQDSLWLECIEFPGILYATSIRVDLSANLHFAFLDGKLRGRGEFLMNCVKWLVDKLRLEKVNAFVPAFCISLIKFLKSIGFREEGRVRNWSRKDSKLFDCIILGMTREEVKDGGVFSAANDGTAGNETKPVDGE